MIRRIRILGIPILTIETDDEPTDPDDEPTDPGDCTVVPLGFAVLADDLPTAHRREDKR